MYAALRGRPASATICGTVRPAIFMRSRTPRMTVLYSRVGSRMERMEWFGSSSAASTRPLQYERVGIEAPVRRATLPASTMRSA